MENKDLEKRQAEAVQQEPVDPDHPLDHAPAHTKRSFLSIGFLFLGFTFFTPTMSSGATIGQSFNFSTLMMILIAGSLILGVYVAMLAVIGARTGVTSIIQAKYTYGKAGVKIVDILIGGTQIFWYAITSQYVGTLFSQGLGLDGRGWEVFFTVIFGVAMCATAVLGVKAMSWVSYLSIPLTIVLLVMSMVMAVDEAGSFQAITEIAPTGEMTVMSAITVIVGTFASGGTTIGTYSRFCKNARDAFIAGIIAFTFGNGIIIFIGMIGGLVFNQGDIIQLMISMGLVIWALVILTINIWVTNTGSAYAYGVSFAELFNRDNRKLFIIGGTVIALLLAAFDVANYFVPVLNLLGIFIPPLGGAIIGDYFLVSKGKIPKLQYVEFKTLRIAPVIAYVLGCIAAYVGDAFGIGIPPLQGIVISAIAVWLLDLLFKKLHIDDAHQVAANAEYI